MNRLFTIIFLIIPSTWAASFVAGKYVVAEVDPVTSVFWRFFLSALVMLPFLFIYRRKEHPDFLDKQWLFHLAISFVLGGLGYHIFFFKALQYSTPTNSALIIGLNPFFTALGEILIFRKRRALNFYVGFLLSFSGAVWVNITRGGQADFSVIGKGELFCLIAALCWSIYTILAKMTKKPEWDSLWLNAYNYLFTAVVLIPFILGNLAFNSISTYSHQAWTGIIYMAIFPTAIGYTLFYIGIQKRGPAWASSFIYLIPSLTAFFDYLFFKVSLTVPFIAGTAFVVLGLFVANRKQ